MHSSRGGIGMRKHGRGGNGGPSPRYKQNQTRENNERLAEDENKRRNRGKMHGSVRQAFEEKS